MLQINKILILRNILKAAYDRRKLCLYEFKVESEATKRFQRYIRRKEQRNTKGKKIIFCIILSFKCP